MSLRQRWEEFAQAPVGQRFQERYHNNHDDQLKWFKKPATLLVGGLILVAGLFMLIAPGPGFLAFFLGAALLAQESLWMAKALDGVDKHSRRAWHGACSIWRKAGTKQKILLVAAALVTLAALLGLGTWAGLQLLEEQNVMPAEL